VRYDEFLNRVQEQASLSSLEEARRVTEATLQTLGERIYRSARDDVATQLPVELSNYLLNRAQPEVTPRHVERFSLEEFYNRVSARAGLSYTQAVDRAPAVMATLREAISSGEWQDLMEELPAEFDQIQDWRS
jgi:uncharacterized protein (DUF2267 family)